VRAVFKILPGFGFVDANFKHQGNIMPNAQGQAETKTVMAH